MEHSWEASAVAIVMWQWCNINQLQSTLIHHIHTNSDTLTLTHTLSHILTNGHTWADRHTDSLWLAHTHTHIPVTLGMKPKVGQLNCFVFRSSFLSLSECFTLTIRSHQWFTLNSNHVEKGKLYAKSRSGVWYLNAVGVIVSVAMDVTLWAEARRWR